MLNRAVAIIEDEHRSLVAVGHGLHYVLETAHQGKRDPDFKLLWAMLYYLEMFPERLHHPKEDQYLFAMLRLRAPEADRVIAGLTREHLGDGALLVELTRLLGHFEAGVPGSYERLLGAVERFSKLMQEHIEQEEKQVFPLARAHLLPEDWVEIAEAFGENGDPRFRGENRKELHEMFERIVNLAPPPIGVGPASTASTVRA